MEYIYSNANQAQGRAPNVRHSISSRFSRLFERRQDQASFVSQSYRTSGACEVPIFMSPSSDHLHVDPEDVEGTTAMPPTWRQNIDHGRPLTVPASSVYSQSPDIRVLNGCMEQIEEDPRPRSPETTHDLEAGNLSTSYATSETQLVREKRRKRRRVAESYREKIAAKKKLGMAFGVTTLATVITYAVLAVTGTANGIMFHVLSLVFILVLMGVFLHSAIMLVILQRRRRARLARHRDWHGSRSGADSVSSRSRSEHSVNPFADPLSEKPVAVVFGGDEVVTTTPRGKNRKVVRPPPPVYGSVRGSKTIRPELLFWHKQNPSPTTPTYEEALNDVHTAVGYQPPQYVSPKRHRTALEASQRISDIHPLERGRLAGLLGNTMSSQRQGV